MTELILIISSVLFPVLVALWILSIFMGKVSFIDAVWGGGFVLIALVGLYSAGVPGPVALVSLILTAVWGARLCLYLLRRFLREGEDRRYLKILGDRTGIQRHFLSLWFVFLFQGILMLVIAAPVVAAFATKDQSLDLWAYAGIGLWGLGIFFEWVGDWQLARFKAAPANSGKVLDTGLWALTRHPNYFGDACVWWGIWMIGHDPVLLFAPALMTFLLVKWSGVPLLERSLKKRRPDYAAYMARTSSFIPMPPRKSTPDI